MIHNLSANTSNFKFRPFFVEIKGFQSGNKEYYIPFIADSNRIKNVEYIIQNIKNSLLLETGTYLIIEKEDCTFNEVLLESNERIKDSNYELEIDILQNIYNIKSVDSSMFNDEETTRIKIGIKE